MVLASRLSACLAAILAAVSLPTVARASSTGLAPVYLGGVTADMANLGQPSATTSFRRAGGAFYAHESYILPNTSGTCPKQTASTTLAAIVSTFASAPAPMAEVGFNTPLGLSTLITCNYQAVGLHPVLALANIVVGATTLASWQPFVDAGRSAGLVAIGPIVSPNLPTSPQDWSNSYWNTAKQMALYGGALGMDTPPLLYTALGKAYITFAQQQLAWCAANHIACIDIVSPANGETTFTADALAWGKAIIAPGPMPTSWVVENYNYGTTPSIGQESQQPSLANTALTAALALQGL